VLRQRFSKEKSIGSTPPIAHKGDARPVTATLKVRVEALEAELSKPRSLVTGRILSASVSVPTGSWRYCGRRPRRIDASQHFETG
jgi:hypothetical protein